MSGNFIQLSREMKDDPFVGTKKGDNCVMYLHLLLSAQWSPSVFEKFGKVYHVRAGEVIKTLDQLVEETKFSRSKWDRFLQKMSKLKYIKTETLPRQAGTLISVCIYGLFESRKTQADAEARQLRDSSETQKNKVIRKEEIKNKGTDKNYSDKFEDFWSIYPRKIDKLKAWETYRKLSLGDQDLCQDNVVQYAAYCESEETETQFIKHCKSYLNGRCFENEWKFKKKKVKRNPYTGEIIK